MDTSPRPRVRFSATGFGSFRGVEQNPSAELISRLARRVDAGGAPTLRAAVVSEVSVEGADALLVRLCEDVREDAAGGAGGAGGASYDVLLHFGVAAGSKVFAIESRAPNEKDLRVPDERGLQPRRLPQLLPHSAAALVGGASAARRQGARDKGRGKRGALKSTVACLDTHNLGVTRQGLLFCTPPRCPPCSGSASTPAR